MSSPLRRLAALLLLALAATVAGATPAWGHAALTGSQPDDGAQLDAAPAEVVLQFNEPVTPSSADSITVVGADGERVDLGLVEEWTAPTVSVALPDSLPDGGYVTSYVVVSEDGHLIRGARTFRVGEGGADVAAPDIDSGGNRVLDGVASVVRGIVYLALLTAVGGALFLAVVARRDADPAPLRRIVVVAAAVAVVATGASWLVQTAQASVDGWGGMTSIDEITAIADQTFGRAAMLRVLGLVALLTGVTAWRHRWWVGVAGLGAAATIVSLSLDGHSASTDPRWLVIGADIVHTAAAAAWFGGLVLLFVAMRARRADDDVAGAGGVVARFSGVATIAVVGVGIAGVALSWAEVRNLDALFTTTYGWALLAKVAIVAAVGAVGLHNNRRLVPSLADQPNGDAWGRLRRTVRLEVVGLIAAIAVTGFLVNIVPARTAATEPAAAGATGPFETTTGLGADIHVEVTVDPAAQGANEILVQLMTHDGRPVEEAPVEVTFALTHEAAGIGPISRPATQVDPADPSRFSAEVEDLVVAGEWTVEVEALIDDFTVERGQFIVPIT